MMNLRSRRSSLGYERSLGTSPFSFPSTQTRKQIAAFHLEEAFIFHPTPHSTLQDYYKDGKLDDKIHAFAPFGYLDFIALMAQAKMVFTDSGGIQEETTVLNIPCITLRDTTERPITLTRGTNVLVHNDPARIIAEAERVLAGKQRTGHCPDIWDGHTAERIVQILTG